MNERTRTATLMLGTVLLLAGLAGLLRGTSDIVSMSLTITGVIMIALGVVFSMRAEQEQRMDERIRKLSTRGLAWSWLITFLIIGALVWNDLLGIIALTVQHNLAIIYAAMILSAFAFQRYLYRRGDVD